MENQILYHGSYMKIEYPEIRKHRLHDIPVDGVLTPDGYADVRG